MTGTVELDPNGYDLVVRFSYDKLLVEEIKNDLPRRRWDPGAKAWRVPAKDVDKVYELCLKHGFEFSADVSGLLAGTIVAKEPPKREPKPKRSESDQEKPERDETRRAVLDADGAAVLLSFPYDEILVATVKELPERRWDRKAKHWKVPPACPGLRGFLSAHDFELGDGVSDAMPAKDPAGDSDGDTSEGDAFE